ncbi:MAG: hypothetical protein K5669_05995 [Lachnospiraceae bacterium]|nr:hypothetical protein [Lachnospiraceae bacterium]
MLVINAILHFLIDGICAYSMFGKYGSYGAEGYLFYNFYAFSLQMPIGALCDLVVSRLKNRIIIKRFYWVVTLLGVLFTLLGMAVGFSALGVGNALFHVGGGLTSIREDEERKLKGRGLGIFVAPGALGLFIGNTLSDYTFIATLVRGAFIVLVLSAVLAGFLRLYYAEKHLIFMEINASDSKARLKDSVFNLVLSAVICFVVVILRSYVGMAVGFSWKNGFVLGLIVTLSIVFGKVAGGFLAAKIGEFKAALISLSAAAVFYVFSEIPVCGVLALFFFNMTMPITLYILIKRLPKLPGFSFGLLTFGLFIGFYMIYSDVKLPVSGNIVGAVGSVISALLLTVILIKKDKKS